jgi:glycosyltransferase involved in cell wall biosynthesis
MRILIVTQYIYPENFKSNELAFELAKRGHHVDVLTGIPNYPEGVYFKGYGLFRKRVERKDGVTFYRCVQTPRGRRASGLGLACNYLSFVFFATLWVLLFFAWKKRYDAIITHEPSPITQLIPAIILGKLRRVHVYSWIMDIWPDAMKNSVNEKLYKIIAPFLTSVTEWTYKNSHKILITSKGFEDLICRNHDYHDKIVYYPNWSVDMSVVKTGFHTPEMPKGFRIMLAGNLGESQNLEAVGECMKLLKDCKELKWIFVGDGSWKKWLDDFIKDNDLQDCAVTLGRFPGETMPSFFKKADAMLVTLRGGFIDLDVTVPARVQSYMSAGKPVLAMIGSGGADLIAEADCGYAVAPSDYRAFAEVIRNKVLSDKESFELKGKNGRLFYEKEFTLDHCINNIEEIISIK